MRTLKSSVFFGLVILIALAATAKANAQAQRQDLHNDWAIQDSSAVTVAPQAVSQSGLDISAWTPATVPSTILANFVATGKYGDPFFGKNLLNLPGSGPSYYVVGKSYDESPTSVDSPFGRSWWYRTEFDAPSDASAGKSIVLHFDGISYRADIWLNGQQVASHTDVAGTYRAFSFDVTSLIHAGQKNTLAVLIYPVLLTDLTPNWVDWNPTPQDKNMGLWRDVYLTFENAVTIKNPFVSTHLMRTGVAELTVETEVTNVSAQNVTGVLKGTIEKVAFEKTIHLAAHETATVRFLPETFAQLKISNPRLWWPAQMGSQEFYPLDLQFQTLTGVVLDQSHLDFGVREVTSKLITADQSRVFLINGKRLQIRGGGWSPDLFLRYDAERVEKELLYTLDLGLNTIRLEGQFGPDEFFQRADHLGILVMPGWVCCNAWQSEDGWPDENYTIAQDSLRDTLYQFRKHPSIFVFLYGSDEAPNDKIEKIYVDLAKQMHWPNPFLASASDRTTKLGGSTGLKMNGPYDYTPPSYWYLDNKKSSHGGAWGFNTETSPGPSIPPLESLRAFIPSQNLWPIDDMWSFHAGENEFYGIKRFSDAIAKRYGTPTDLQDFVRKAQVMAYDNHRAMFEAFGKNKYQSATGIIQWMLNNSWPSLIWHLYDYELRPGGSFFGVKKANEPLHIQFSLDDRSVVVVNGTYSDVTGLKASAQIYDTNMKKVYEHSVPVSVSADATTAAFVLPKFDFANKAYFVRLALADHNRKIVSHNFYWLSTQAEAYQWDYAGDDSFAYTPVLQEGDLTALNSLAPAQVSTASHIDTNSQTGQVQIKNTGSTLAFFIRFRLLNGSNEILPVYWQDGDISLVPGESRTILFHWSGPTPRGTRGLRVQIDGWNLNSNGQHAKR